MNSNFTSYRNFVCRKFLRVCNQNHKLNIDFVQGGIVIVDSPGIGESRQMTQMVKDYFATAFAFIYVINSGNAGGLQPDRVGG